MSLFDYWLKKHNVDLENAMQLQCFRSEVFEYDFVRRSREWGLGNAKFEYNWNGMYDHDVWYVENRFSWLPCEVKHATTTFAPKQNDFGLSCHNFLPIRLSQLQRYCTEGLEMCVWLREVSMDNPANQRVCKFIRINGVDDGQELVSSKTLVFVDIKRLCDMYVRKQRILELRIPYAKRPLSERHDGRCLAFRYDDFPNIPLA